MAARKKKKGQISGVADFQREAAKRGMTYAQLQTIETCYLLQYGSAQGDWRFRQDLNLPSV